MMGRRQKLKGGDEVDCVHHAPLCVFDKSGVRKKTKRKMNKRFRKDARIDLQNANVQLSAEPWGALAWE